MSESRDPAEIAAERSAEVRELIGQAEKLEATGKPMNVLAANDLRLRAIIIDMRIGVNSD